jgi:hypothetical protein
MVITMIQTKLRTISSVYESLDARPQVELTLTVGLAIQENQPRSPLAYLQAKTANAASLRRTSGFSRPRATRLMALHTRNRDSGKTVRTLYWVFRKCLPFDCGRPFLHYPRKKGYSIEAAALYLRIKKS